MLNARDISMMKTAVSGSGFLSTPCTILRASGDTFVEHGTTTCFVSIGSGTTTYSGLPSVLNFSSWTIMMPANADVQPGDRLRTPDATYVVQRINEPATDIVVMKATCYQLYGEDGVTPVSLPTNYTISILRRPQSSSGGQTLAPQPVAGLETVPVYITETPAVLQMPTGAVAPSFEVKMMWSPQWDIRDGDRVAGYAPQQSGQPAILTVQHVTDPGDVPRRVSLLVGQEPAGYSR